MKKISGFTILRNGTKFDYPYLESLRSLLPLVDELIVNVGVGEDDTRKRLEKFALEEGNGKVVLFDSEWPLNDPEKRRGGQILADQTNLALDRCTGEWCIYLQADEVLHEEDYPRIRAALAEYASDAAVDGLLFHYIHFYGSFDVMQETRSAYRREVRIVKRSSGARSIGDAQSFRKPNGEKPAVILLDARIYHYGWVRPPEAMKEKTTFMDTLYHGAQTPEAATPHSGDNYRYKRFWGLKPYRGTHPSTMRARIAAKNWKWDLANSPLHFTAKDAKKVVLDTIENLTGKRLFEYRSYRLRKR